MLALALGAGCALSAAFVAPTWSYVALANYVWMVALLARVERQGAVLLSPWMVVLGSTMLALVGIEHGFPMFELALGGTPGFWSNALNIYTAVFLIAFVPVFRMIAGADRHRSGPLTMLYERFADATTLLVLAAIAVIALAMIRRGLISGFPLIEGSDRFAFRRFAADKVTLYALNFKFALAFAMGVVTFCLPTRPFLRATTIVAFTLLMALYFLFGDKFFTQIVAIMGFVAPALYTRRRAGSAARTPAVLAIAAVALASVSAVTWYIYSDGGRQTPAATIERLGGRIVGQGELWYLQARIGAPLLAWDNQLVDNTVAALAVKNVDLFAVEKSIGPSYFSNRYAPDYLRASLHRNAGRVTYTAALAPVGLAAFGWIGLAVLMAICGAIMALVSAYLAYAIRSKSVLSALFSAYVFTLVMGGLGQAAPWNFMSLFALKWLAVIALVELVLALVGRSQVR
ncbi:DUF6418 domain-containing protein [Novosphingobium lentum]|uniref:DUF6418 domain-containing protein n=1 Tax=Novosphingobium lentum TaxID=145287 RepID=UPI000A8C1227|nr:DUF6418 domain-containing protein [Novosphingobium lentum]